MANFADLHIGGEELKNDSEKRQMCSLLLANELDAQDQYEIARDTFPESWIKALMEAIREEEITHHAIIHHIKNYFEAGLEERKAMDAMQSVNEYRKKYGLNPIQDSIKKQETVAQQLGVEISDI